MDDPLSLPMRDFSLTADFQLANGFSARTIVEVEVHIGDLENSKGGIRLWWPPTQVKFQMGGIWLWRECDRPIRVEWVVWCSAILDQKPAHLLWPEEELSEHVQKRVLNVINCISFIPTSALALNCEVMPLQMNGSFSPKCRQRKSAHATISCLVMFCR